MKGQPEAPGPLAARLSPRLECRAPIEASRIAACMVIGGASPRLECRDSLKLVVWLQFFRGVSH